MREVTKTVYLFNELSVSAKEKAREWWRCDLDYGWSNEAKESIFTFARAFGAEVTNWCVGPWQPVEYEHNATNQNFRGVKLKQFNRDHMPTGYCLDCALWQTFYDEFKRTGDAKHAFEQALDAGFKEWREDWEYQYSDEATDDAIIANEYEFDEDGNRA